MLTRNSADPFTTETINVVVGASTSDIRISFSNAGGDNIGALLDNVSLSSNAVPEPSSMAMCGIAGAAGLAIARRRRKVAA